MLRLLFAAIVAVLVAESIQDLADPTDEPDTTKPGEIIIKKLSLPTEEPDVTEPGLGKLEGLKPVGIVPIRPHIPCNQPDIKCWTKWYDRDDPSGTGDWETLKNLRKKNPGKICPNPVDIEVVTLYGKSVEKTGEKIYKMDTTTGFICRKKDQPDYKCEDYKVRFSCPLPYCDDGVCWTKWLDRDDPSGTGDWELLKLLRKKYKICEKPLYIEVETTNFPTSASNTGQKFYVYNPTEGFVCRNKDQKWGKCRDYKVRFGCKC